MTGATARRAGISVPLFALRSSRSWGIGEIGDLPAFARWLELAGQSVLQILPLNELAPMETSPYSPLSAMAIDPHYLSLWMMPDAADAREPDALDALRRSPSVDYTAVRRVKADALRRAFDRFFDEEWKAGSERAASLREYMAAEAWWLEDYALYRALRSRYGDRPWMEWPAGLRDREPESIDAARRELSHAMLFHRYLQWCADSQWREVRRELKGVAILGDFPFMVTLDSADVWSRRDDFLIGASVGTPPDAFSETGQEWGLPPYNWMAARANDFAWLRLRARRQAALYDGFRVDHLVGFYRTYVRPFGGAPYFMPSAESDQVELGETVLRILMETGADVSVEDLGTVPDFVRQSVARIGLPGYKVLRWERDDPERYPPVSVAMTGTHDTDTLAVWWTTLTADEQRRFGGRSGPFDDGVRDTILERVYRSGSNLILLPLQDVFGWPDRINHPATVSSANWSFVLPWVVDAWTSQPEAVERAGRLATWCEETGR